MSKGPWNEQTLARLRQLWSEGHSTNAIARMMGLSKNSIVGKAHRLELDGRPSPIKRGSDSATPKPRQPVPPLPALPSETKAIATAVLAEPAPTANAAIPLPLPPLRQPTVAPAPISRPIPRSPTCCWPIGEPGTKSFRFCDDASVTGKPYCLDHCQLAYVRIKDSKEDAA